MTNKAVLNNDPIPSGYLGRCSYCGKPLKSSIGGSTIAQFCSAQCGDKWSKYYSPSAKSKLREKDGLEVRLCGWSWDDEKSNAGWMHRRFNLSIQALDDLLEAIYVIEQREYS